MGACSIDGGGCPCRGEGADEAPQVKTYLCHYMHQGHVHSAEIDATDMADAKARLESLGASGVVDCAIEPSHEV